MDIHRPIRWYKNFTRILNLDFWEVSNVDLLGLSANGTILSSPNIHLIYTLKKKNYFPEKINSSAFHILEEMKGTELKRFLESMQLYQLKSSVRNHGFVYFHDKSMFSLTFLDQNS